MSGVFGVFHTDGSPVQREPLERMDAAMAYWGPDGGGLHLAGQVGLASRLLRVTAEDQHEHQPVIDGPLVLVSHARLDNRADLCRLLGLANTVDLPESALILAAYRRYGEDCVQHLRGDWVFALWDASKQCLLVARDATGNTGLYWWAEKGVLVFSNGIKGVLAHPRVPCEPDPLAVAGFLTVFLHSADQGDTVYKGIRRLTPGHFLLADARGVRVQRWWQPEDLAPLLLPSLEEYYQAFFELYDDAVAQRLRVHGGTVAATLSAGLDSGSVVALAAPHLARRGQRLAAYVHRPLHELRGANTRRTGDEFPLAQKTAAHVGNVDVIPLQSADVLVLEGIRRALQTHDVPGHADAHAYWIHDLLQSAQASGARVLLTGQGGNSTVSFNGNGSLLPSLLAGRFREVVSAIRHEEFGAWQGVKQRLVKPALRPLRARVRQQFLGARAWADYSAIDAGFAAELGLQERMRQANFDPSFSAPMSDPAVVQGFRLGLRRGGSGYAYWMEIGAAYALDTRDPTRDQRLVEFCWRLPDEVFWGRGVQRALIRRGMHAHLPKEVLFCKQKGLQAADVDRRLFDEKGEALRLLDQLEAHPLARTWLDLKRLRGILDGLDGSKPGARQATAAGAFARGVSVGLFLTRF